MADRIPEQKLLCLKLYDFVAQKCPYNQLQLDILRNNLLNDIAVISIDPKNDSEDIQIINRANLYFIFTNINNNWELRICIFNNDIKLNILPDKLEILSENQIKRSIIEDSERCYISSNTVTLIIGVSQFTQYSSDIVIKKLQFMQEWIKRNYEKLINEEVIRLRRRLNEEPTIIEKLDTLIFNEISKLSNDLILTFTLDECIHILNYLASLDTTKYRIKRRMNRKP